MKKLVLSFIFFLSILSAASAQQRNIVLIYMDDRDDFVSKGYMPKLESMVGGQGVTFKNSFVTTPVCGPSRASLHTGLYAHNHGVWGNDIGGGWAAFKPLLENSLGVWMQQAGYTTGFYGKLMNAFTAPNGYQVPGWDRYSIYYGAGYRYFDYQLYEQGVLNQYGSADEDYLTDVLANKTITFIKGAATNHLPFFVIFAPLTPHAPATPAPRHVGYHDTTPFPRSIVFNEPTISDKPLPIRDLPLLTQEQQDSVVTGFRRRLDALMAVDEAGEKIINTLSSLGVLANTDIIVTSDNGLAFGSHRWLFKMLQYDVTIRVPLMWRGPGIAVGQTRDQFVSNLDVTATILSRAGVRPPYELDGKAFAAVMQQNGTNVVWRNGVFVENYLNDPRFPEQGYYYAGVRTPSLLFNEVRGPSYVEREAYNMDLDPFQSVNTIYAIPSDERAEWAALVQRLKSCRGANCNDY